MGGKSHTIDLGETIGRACNRLLEKIYPALTTLIARASSDSVATLLQNIVITGGGSRIPATTDSVEAGLHHLQMDGKETFKNAVNAMMGAANEALRRCEIDITQIKLVIPHQANSRIINAVGERLGVKPDQVFVNLDKYGNTSAASVAIALDEAVEQGRLKRGDLALLVVFGAGLTWAAAVIEW